MTAVTLTDTDFELNPNQAPLGYVDMFSNWIGEKGKYTCEAIKNAAFIVAHFPRVWGGQKIGELEGASAQINNIKKFMAMPGAIKGAVKLVETLQEGKKCVRDIIGDACYVIGDTIDTVVSFDAFGIKDLPASVKKVLAPIKDLSGLIGLTNSAYNLTNSMEALRNKNVTIEIPPNGSGVAAKNEADKQSQIATTYNKKYTEAKINNMWWDRMRNICAIGMCAIGLIKFAFASFGYTATVASLSNPWIFVALSTAGVFGKAVMHFKSQEAEVWKGQVLKAMPTSTSAA